MHYPDERPRPRLPAAGKRGTAAKRSVKQASAPAAPMKLAMLARNPGLYSHRRLIEAAQQRGHALDVINTLHVHMKITSSRPTLMYDGRTLPRYDAVIPRIGA